MNLNNNGILECNGTRSDVFIREFQFTVTTVRASLSRDGGSARFPSLYCIIFGLANGSIEENPTSTTSLCRHAISSHSIARVCRQDYNGVIPGWHLITELWQYWSNNNLFSSSSAFGVSVALIQSSTVRYPLAPIKKRLYAVFPLPLPFLHAAERGSRVVSAYSNFMASSTVYRAFMLMGRYNSLLSLREHTLWILIGNHFAAYPGISEDSPYLFGTLLFANNVRRNIFRRLLFYCNVMKFVKSTVDIVGWWFFICTQELAASSEMGCIHFSDTLVKVVSASKPYHRRAATLP